MNEWLWLAAAAAALAVIAGLLTAVASYRGTEGEMGARALVTFASVIAAYFLAVKGGWSL